MWEKRERDKNDICNTSKVNNHVQQSRQKIDFFCYFLFIFFSLLQRWTSCNALVTQRRKGRSWEELRIHASSILFAVSDDPASCTQQRLICCTQSNLSSESRRDKFYMPVATKSHITVIAVYCALQSRSVSHIPFTFLRWKKCVRVFANAARNILPELCSGVCVKVGFVQIYIFPTTFSLQYFSFYSFPNVLWQSNNDITR